MKMVKRIYILYILLLVIAAGVTLFILWGKLADYQADKEQEAAERELHEQEQRAPQLAFENYANEIDASWWADQYIAEREAAGTPMLETREQVQAFFAEKMAGHELQHFKASDWTTAHPVYVVRVSDVDELRATVEMTGASLSWKAGDIHIEAPGQFGGEIQVPYGCPVYCNGIPLDDSYITETGAGAFPFTGYADQLSAPIQLAKYAVEGLLAEPELTCDGEGYVFSEADQCLVSCVTGDEADRLVQKSKDFLHSYLYYVTGGSTASGERLGNCLAHVRKGSEAHERIASSASSIAWTVTYSNLEIDYVSEGAPIIWADNARSVDLIYHAYATVKGARTDYSGEDLRFRVLFMNQGGGWDIVAFRTE